MNWIDVLKGSPVPTFAQKNTGVKPEDRKMGSLEHQGVKNLQSAARKEHLDRTGRTSTTGMTEREFKRFGDEQRKIREDARERNPKSIPESRGYSNRADYRPHGIDPETGEPLEVEEEEIQEMPLENFTNYPVGEEGSAFATPDRPWMGPTGETPTPEDPNWQKQIQAAQQ